MKVDIYIKERKGSRKIRIPWLPDAVKLTEGETQTAEYKIINKGDVAVPTGTGLATYSWEGVWPGKYRTNGDMMRGKWQEPKTYHNIIRDWMQKGTALNVMVTGYPVNANVYVKKYEAEASGGFGDIVYNIELEQQREITITATKQKHTTKRPSTTKKSYTIKSGDTLWGIATRFYRNGSQWTKIYKANKSIIESTAKKRGFRSSSNGHWIFPGVKIQIP